jgi:hypothetical protein
VVAFLYRIPMKRSSHSSRKASTRSSSSYLRQFGHQRPGRTRITQSIFPARRTAVHFTDLPPPKNNAPYHLDLADVISQDEIKLINENGSISFHAVGDTGGINNATYQQINAEAMETDFSNPNKQQPTFFSIIDGFALLDCSMSGEYNHLKKRISCILNTLYVPIHLWRGSSLSGLR